VVFDLGRPLLEGHRAEARVHVVAPVRRTPRATGSGAPRAWWATSSCASARRCPGSEPESRRVLHVSNPCLPRLLRCVPRSAGTGRWKEAAGSALTDPPGNGAPRVAAFVSDDLLNVALALTFQFLARLDAVEGPQPAQDRRGDRYGARGVGGISAATRARKSLSLILLCLEQVWAHAGATRARAALGVAVVLNAATG
jgi:hypothetical protein